MLIREKAESGQLYEVYWKLDSKGYQLCLTVSDGQVFVLGDNRDEAYDSRKFGTLPLTDIIGVAKQVWFSLADSGLRIGGWMLIKASTASVQPRRESGWLERMLNISESGNPPPRFQIISRHFPKTVNYSISNKFNS